MYSIATTQCFFRTRHKNVEPILDFPRAIGIARVLSIPALSGNQQNLQVLCGDENLQSKEHIERYTLFMLKLKMQLPIFCWDEANGSGEGKKK